MSDSNIGAQKGKSCINHIWIINGINQEVNSSKRHAQLVMQSFDYSQMFDSMSLKTTISDLYDYGLQDDLLVLLNEVNKNVSVSVSTCYGATERVLIPSLVAQGDMFSPPRNCSSGRLHYQEAGEGGQVQSGGGGPWTSI